MRHRRAIALDRYFDTVARADLCKQTLIADLQHIGKIALIEQAVSDLRAGEQARLIVLFDEFISVNSRLDRNNRKIALIMRRDDLRPYFTGNRIKMIRRVFRIRGLAA